MHGNACMGRLGTLARGWGACAHAPVGGVHSRGGVHGGSAYGGTGNLSPQPDPAKAIDRELGTPAL